MADYLSPQNHRAAPNQFDPYEKGDAAKILRHHDATARELLLQMAREHARYPDGMTALSNSPARGAPYVAGALKTLGYVTEGAFPNGACGLRLTAKALRELQEVRRG